VRILPPARPSGAPAISTGTAAVPLPNPGPVPRAAGGDLLPGISWPRLPAARCPLRAQACPRCPLLPPQLQQERRPSLPGASTPSLRQLARGRAARSLRRREVPGTGLGTGGATLGARPPGGGIQRGSSHLLRSKPRGTSRQCSACRLARCRRRAPAWRTTGRTLPGIVSPGRRPRPAHSSPPQGLGRRQQAAPEAPDPLAAQTASTPGTGNRDGSAAAPTA
jgi:hypothetical protein